MKSSINCLAAVVAIAVSESKKAVSATAVAIVGIGLLSAPVEQVQAQSSLPVVSEVILSDFDFTSSGWFTVEIDVKIPSTWVNGAKYCWSGLYNRTSLGGVRWVDSERFSFYDAWIAGFLTFDYEHYLEFYHSAYSLYEIYACKMVPHDPRAGDESHRSSPEWVEVCIFPVYTAFGSVFFPAAFVYDSNGNYYSVPVTID